MRVFADWTTSGLAHAARNAGRSPTRVETVASYACHDRYGRAGGRIGNHAPGRACGAVSTVLDPNYNAALRDHLHLDLTDEYRGGTFCR